MRQYAFRGKKRINSYHNNKNHKDPAAIIRKNKKAKLVIDGKMAR